MKQKRMVWGALFFQCTLLAGTVLRAESGLELSPKEQQQILQRLQSIYSGRELEKPFAEILNEVPPKYSAIDGSELRPNQVLRLDQDVSQLSRFEQMAQRKLNPEYMKFEKAWFSRLKKAHKEGQDSGTWEVRREHDKVERLAFTWMNDVETHLGAIPTSGVTGLPMWSDDYWRLQWGGISYRYSEAKEYRNYKEAVAAYTQPMEWLSVFPILGSQDLSKKIESWSPAEKYDLSLGDLNFTLALEQKSEGKQNLDENAEVPSWMGLCHGWAAAAMMTPKPVRGFEVWGPNNSKVKWFAHDVRALTSLAWAKGVFPANGAGARCETKKPEVYENGRLKESECFDTNPATFHLALANLVGRAKAAFVMDSAYDYEVWNQPVAAYRLTYFNPLEPKKQSSQWSDVAVPYDSSFKLRDRFQHPLTRGWFNVDYGKYEDALISQIVGVVATVVYLGEVYPFWGDGAREERWIRVTYTYDLELAKEGTGDVVVGGEWHYNAHPDFLWVPQKSSVSKRRVDRQEVNYDGTASPSESLTQLAKEASQEGYPLCRVVSKLLQLSSLSGEAPLEYSCQ